MSSDEVQGDAQAIIDMVKDALSGRLQVLEPGVRYVHTIDGHETFIDTDDLMDGPRRTSGTRKATTAAGLVSAVMRYATEDSVIYSDTRKFNLTCVVNDDPEHDGTTAGPGWRDHRVEFTPTKTDEWVAWLHGQGLTDQETFANRIEHGAPELVDPAAGVMLDMAQTFTASTTAKFKKQARLANGAQQFVYEEEVEASAGDAGQVTIPETFTISVAPFLGAEKVIVSVRLKYRLTGGKLQIGYEVIRPGQVERDAFEQITMDVIDATAVFVIEGEAPLSAGRR